jgi:RNA polymerase sigma factor FliA
MASAAIKTQLAKDDARTRRDELISDYFHLVGAIAAHIQRSLAVHVELDDLTHAGVMGLFDAATKYRTDKNVAFPTYAKHRIRGAILDSLRQMDWASRDLRRRFKQMETATRDLRVKLQREPTDAEVASTMGLDLRRWHALLADFRTLGLAVARLRSEREDQTLPDKPCSPADCPDQQFAKTELRETLGTALEKLPARYRQVVKLYYEGNLTMKEIGGILGVNESRVSQIHKSALQRMHMALDECGIRSAAAF